MIWFTSDLHLGHTNIAGPELSNWKDGYRTFKTVSAMDTELLKQLNSLVQPDDTLYFLGDFCFKGSIQGYRDRIMCKNITFIKGNHDKAKDITPVFGHCFDYIEEDIGEIKFVLCHYSMRIWNKSHKSPGSIHLYGHSHSKLEDDPWGRSMDVGVDNAYRMYGVYAPFSLDTIMKIMSTRVSKTIDHHGTSKNKKNEIREN